MSVCVCSEKTSSEVETNPIKQLASCSTGSVSHPDPVPVGVGEIHRAVCVYGCYFVLNKTAFDGPTLVEFRQQVHSRYVSHG